METIETAGSGPSLIAPGLGLAAPVDPAARTVPPGTTRLPAITSRPGTTAGAAGRPRTRALTLTVVTVILLAACNSIPETPQDIPSSFWGDYARSTYTLEEFHQRIVIGAESGAVNLNYLGEYAASEHTVATFSARWEQFFAADIPGEVGSYAGAALTPEDYRARFLAFADSNELYPDVFGNYAASSHTVETFVERHQAAREANIPSSFRGDFAQSAYTPEEFAARLAEIDG